MSPKSRLSPSIIIDSVMPKLGIQSSWMRYTYPVATCGSVKTSATSKPKGMAAVIRPIMEGLPVSASIVNPYYAQFIIICRSE
jgi:hypothetical protein